MKCGRCQRDMPREKIHHDNASCINTCVDLEDCNKHVDSMETPICPACKSPITKTNMLGSWQCSCVYKTDMKDWDVKNKERDK